MNPRSRDKKPLTNRRVAETLRDPDVRSIACDVAIQPDGKIVAAGFVGWGDYWSPAPGPNQNNPDGSQFAVARYNTDGTLDETFGGTGTVVTPIPNLFRAVARSVVIQSDGKIVLSGWADDGSTAPSRVIVLARYNTNGSLDASFGLSGRTSALSAGSLTDAALSTARDADYAALAAAALYEQSGSRRGAVDRLFSDLGGTAAKNKSRTLLNLDLMLADLALQY